MAEQITPIGAQHPTLHSHLKLKTMYQRKIKQILEAAGITNVDPRHIEAYMRLKHGTLDGISSQQLIKSIHVCLADIDTDGILNAEKLAQSYAL